MVYLEKEVEEEAEAHLHATPGLPDVCVTPMVPFAKHRQVPDSWTTLPSGLCFEVQGYNILNGTCVVIFKSCGMVNESDSHRRIMCRVCSSDCSDP